MVKLMSNILTLFIGIFIGIGFITPGVSGGAIAVILGVYDKIFYSLRNVKKLDNFKFLLLLSIGVSLGTICFGRILLMLFDSREIIMSYIFMGLIIGSIPALIKNIKKHKQFKLKWLPFIISLFISIGLALLEMNGYGINISNYLIMGKIPVFLLFIAGILYAVGKVVPGVSGSALLMLVGMYKLFLEIISNPLNLSFKTIIILIPFVLGIVIGIIFLVKLMNYLFARFYVSTYSAIIGFVIGSIFYLFPGFSFNFMGVISIISFILSGFLSYILTK